MVPNPPLNAVGATALVISALNSFFSMLDPILTGLFYIVSITWLVIQIYYKVKYKK
jgi:hypothetical protein